MTQFHITIHKDYLQSALDPVSRVARDKNTLPILNHALLQADSERGLAITGTNLETKIIARTFTGQTEAPGTIAVSAGKLFDLVRLSPADAHITLKLDGEMLHVQHGRSRYKLLTRPAEDFPAFDAGDLTHSIQISATDLLSGLQRVAFCMASGDVRHYLNGLALQLQDGPLYTVASDGHRLTAMRTEIDGAHQTPKLQIIPRTAAEKITALLTSLIKGAPRAIVHLQMGERTLAVTAGDIQLSTRLIEGVYPDTNRVIPTETPTRLTAHCAGLIAAIERVTVLSDRNEKALRLDISERGLALDAANQDHESGAETLDLIAFEGPALTVGFNAHYLLDALRTVSADTVALHLSDRSALVVDPDASGWTAVVMPMRL